MGASADGITCCGSESFETLDCHPRGSYVHQFADAAGCGSTQFQDGSIDQLWQQMDEGNFGGKAGTDLLMTSERIVPDGKAEEHDAILLEEQSDVKKELLFT